MNNFIIDVPPTCSTQIFVYNYAFCLMRHCHMKVMLHTPYWACTGINGLHFEEETHTPSLSLYTTGSIYYPFSDHVLFVRETEDPRGDAEAEPEGTPESETIKGSHETRVQVYYGIVHLAKAFLSLKYLDCLIILCNFSGNTGIREREDVPRETREETHHRHQEDGKERANGRREDHGEGPGQD